MERSLAEPDKNETSEVEDTYREFFYPLRSPILPETFKNKLSNDLSFGVVDFKSNHESKVLVDYKSAEEALMFVDSNMDEGIITFYESLPKQENLLDKYHNENKLYLGVLSIKPEEVNKIYMEGNMEVFQREIERSLGKLPNYIIKLFNPYDGTRPVRKGVLEIGYVLIEKEK